MRILILIICLCQTAEAQSIVTSSDRQSITLSTNGGQLPVQTGTESQDGLIDIQRELAELRNEIKQYREPTSPKPKPVTITLPMPLSRSQSVAEPVTSDAAIVGSTERDAEDHLRDFHGIVVTGKSLAEMEVIHDDAHGGSGYHFPGRASMSASQSKTVMKSASRCPGGVCPVRRSRSRRR